MYVKRRLKLGKESAVRTLAANFDRKSQILFFKRSTDMYLVLEGLLDHQA